VIEAVALKGQGMPFGVRVPVAAHMAEWRAGKMMKPQMQMAKYGQAIARRYVV
jgi:hypothetical protein